MSTLAHAMSADAAAGAITSLALLKRKHIDGVEEHPDMKRMKTGPPQTPGLPPATAVPQTTALPPSTAVPATAATPQTAPQTTAATKAANPKARAIRLEQNRKAARESRRRKKVMIEELQRSVIFFSRANSTLKQQNDDLTRLLINAQAQVAAIEGGETPSVAATSVQTSSVVAPSQTPAAAVETKDSKEGQQQAAEARAVATQAIYESQGFPAAAARAAAQTMNASAATAATATSTTTAFSSNNTPAVTPAAAAAAVAAAIPSMQPGATMQAMANFQQAAATAMQAAMQGMQSIPGVNMSQLAATPVGANAQQAYTDTMTALAMQQAAAAAGQQLAMQSAFPFMAQAGLLAWQQAQQTQQNADPTTQNK